MDYTQSIKRLTILTFLISTFGTVTHVIVLYYITSFRILAFYMFHNPSYHLILTIYSFPFPFSVKFFSESHIIPPESLGTHQIVIILYPVFVVSTFPFVYLGRTPLYSCETFLRFTYVYSKDSLIFFMFTI